MNLDLIVDKHFTLMPEPAKGNPKDSQALKAGRKTCRYHGPEKE
jgi:hypothetical protein